MDERRETEKGRRHTFFDLFIVLRNGPFVELLGLWITSTASVQIVQRRGPQIFHDALVFLELYGVEQPCDETNGDGNYQPYVRFREILRVVFT